ncbi:beta strand repeat-containing protein [Chloroflexota bacterium]
MRQPSKIWHASLGLVLIVAAVFFADPAVAAPGGMMFTSQQLPTGTGAVMVNGSDVGAIAVASDSTTVYAIDSASAAGAIYKSLNAGQTFTLMASPAAVALTDIAVASDNPEAIATTDGTAVYISNNGGTTWFVLPAHGVAGVTITDVAVGPARTGTSLGREYAITLANNNNAALTGGDVLIIGDSTTWVSAGTTSNITSTNDYMAVAFSPHFVNDRVLAVVGSSGTFAKLQLINTNTTDVIRSTTFGSTTTDFQTAGITNNIIAADIAVPSDWDPGTDSGQRTYVTIAAAANFTDNDVYRIDGDTSIGLDVTTNAPLFSVSYSGTIDGGTIFVGWQNTNIIKFSSNPQVSSPTWTTCKKSPGLAANTGILVRVASDFATSRRVFAGTTGVQSAFNVSESGGVSFNAEALIDNGVADDVVSIQTLEMTSDGTYLFMGTSDGTYLALWKSTIPVTPESWSRVSVVTGTTGLVKLNRDWIDAQAIYFADLVLSGNIYSSSDGGGYFVTRSAPSGWISSAMAVEDANTVYIGDVTGNVRRSTNGGMAWMSAVAAGAGAIASLQVPEADYLLVGGTGACSYSTDGGNTFTEIANGLLPATTYQILADDDFANNKTIYIGGNNAAAGNIMRYVIGESSTFETLGNPTGAAIVNLQMQNGVMYGQSAAAVDRNLNPRTATGTVVVNWDTMATGAPAGMTTFAVGTGGGNVVYAGNGATTLWAFGDIFATVKPTLVAPGDGASVSIDPVSGRAERVTLSWEPIGTGTAAGNGADLRIRVKGDNWAAAATTPAASTAVDSASPNVTMAAFGAIWAYTMSTNTEYEWQVRFDSAVSGQVIRTPWSDPFTIQVQRGSRVRQPHVGPVIMAPRGHQVTNLIPSISWAPYPGTTKYQIILSTDAAGKNRVAGTPVFVTIPAWLPAENLEYGTTYFAFVTAVEPTVSSQSVISFTTIAKPAAAPEPAPPMVVNQQSAPSAPVINIPPLPAPNVPAYIWAIIIGGVILIVTVTALIVITNRTHIYKLLTGSKEDMIMGILALILGLLGGACAVMGISTATGIVPFISDAFSAQEYLGYPMFWLNLAIVLFLASIASILGRGRKYD